MNDNWLEIADILQLNVQNDSTESIYQHDIESCFRILGWKKQNNTLQSQVTLNYGNCNTLRPDIVLHKDNNAVLPIEIKRPGIHHTERQAEQLVSYMRHLKLNVGLFIGHNIQLYYDYPGDRDKPISILTAELQGCDSNGQILCDLLHFDKFDLLELEEFCKSKYLQIENKKKLLQSIAEYLSPANAEKNIKDLIINKFTEDGFDKNIIAEEINNITINVGQFNKINHERQDRHVYTTKKIVHKEIESQSTHSGKAKFSLDGSDYVGIGSFVLKVVKQYVHDHPNVTFKELTDAFPPEISANNKQGLVRPLAYIEDEYEGKKTVFFTKPNEIIRLHDQTEVIVYNQWGNNGTCERRFQRFLEYVEKDLKYHIYSK